MSNSSSAPLKRVLSGMRPTGKLHLGNYMGALHNWVRLQHEYDCYFFIADWHALTTDYADPSMVKQNTLDVALDWLGAGLDPEKCVIFVQSHVKQHAELHLLFSMITPLGWLERVPTYKEQQENITGKDLSTYGFLGYPLLQSADILIYQADFVPVGQDQVAHVELTREVARRFNQFYFERFGWTVVDENTRILHRNDVLQVKTTKPLKREQIDQFFCSLHYIKGCNCSYTGICETHRNAAQGEQSCWNVIKKAAAAFPANRNENNRPILPEPQALLTPSPKLPGTDGRKMSKSYGNTILLTDPEPVVRQKLKPMVTDPARVRRTDPGNPDVCPVGDLHKVFSSQETLAKVYDGCKSASIGCIECKGWAADSVIKILQPIQERRRKYEQDLPLVEAILVEGNKRATTRAEQTMQVVREAMGLSENFVNETAQ